MSSCYAVDNEYSVRSGVLTAVCSRLAMRVNEYGEYEYEIPPGGLTDEELELVSKVDTMSDASVNEDVLGRELFGSTPDIRHTRELGYYSDLYIGHVADSDSRKRSSSGGIATWLSCDLLKSGEIDAVIHAKKGSVEGGPLYTYGISRNIDEIVSGAKSRYYPLELSEVLSEVRSRPGSYLLVGIPSFITEIRLLQRLDPVFRKRIKFTLSLVCGHQKSMKYAESIARQAGFDPNVVTDMDFRKKVDGVPANRYINEISGIVDGQSVTKVVPSTELFGVNWAHGFFKTKFSDYVDDAFGETADITLGDAWLPNYSRDSRGHNIVVVRNPMITEALRRGMDRGEIDLVPADATTITSSQSGCVHHYIDEIPYRLWLVSKNGTWYPKTRTEPSLEAVPVYKRRVQDLRIRFRDRSRARYLNVSGPGGWKRFKRGFYFDIAYYRCVYVLIVLRKRGILGTFRKALELVTQKSAKEPVDNG